MRLDEVLAWIESHQGQTMVQGAKFNARKQAASVARGAATRAANVAAANQQKTTALAKGGRYQEGNTIVTVGAPQQQPGRNLSVQLNERLGFSDTTQIRKETLSNVIKRNVGEHNQQITQEERIQRETQTKGVPTEAIKKEGRNLSVTLNESLGFKEPERREPKGTSAPLGGRFIAGSYLVAGGDQVFVKKGKIKETREPFDFGKSLNDWFENIREQSIGVGEYYKNLGLSILQGEAKLGSGYVSTLGGGNRIIPVSPEAKGITEFVKKETIPDTYEQKLFQGKFSEITPEALEANPRLKGQAAGFFSSFIVGGGGPKSIGITTEKIGEKLAVSAENKAVKQFSDYLKSVGDTFGLERLGGEKGKGTYISSGGTEAKPKPLEVLRVGRNKSVFQQKNPVTEYTPTGERQPTLSPSEITTRGGLKIGEKEKMGLEQLKGKEGLPKYIFRSPTKTKPGERKYYNKLILSGEGKEIAKGVTAPLKNIISGKNLEKFMGQPITKTRTLIPKEVKSKYYNKEAIVTSRKIPNNNRMSSVFTETKAEKIIKDIVSPRNTGLSKTPFPKYGPEKERIGAGGPGKAKGFTEQQIKQIKESVTPEIKTKSDMDILFQKPRFEPGGYITPYSTYQTQETKQYQTPKTKEKGMYGGIQDYISTKVISPQKSKNEGILRFTDFLRTEVTPKKKQKEEGTLIFKDELSYVLGRQQKQKQPEVFKFVDELRYKLTPGGGPPPPEIPPPPEFPPELIPKLKPPPPIPYFPPLSLSSYGFSEPQSTKRVYAAYGLSEDINIKVLPTYSRYGSTSSVFKAQIKEDKRIQKLFYGTKTRKTKKAKSKRKGKKR